MGFLLLSCDFMGANDRRIMLSSSYGFRMAWVASRFFTAWVLVVVALGVWTHDTFDLLWLTSMTVVGGVYLTYVYPRRFVLALDGSRCGTDADACWTFEGHALRVVDLLLHWVPWILVLRFCGPHRHPRHRAPWATAGLVLAYLTYVGGVSGALDVYQARPVDLACIVVAMTAITAVIAFHRRT